MTAIDRTAYPRFKRVVPARELVEAFTPTVAEVAWAREKTQSDQHLLALVVWLKSYQRLGYFPKLDEVPAVVVEHVRGLLGLSDEVRAEHDADRTAKWHRGLVRALVGVKYDAGKARVIAEEAIGRAVTTKDNPADLINVALEELVRARCELPGFSTLDRLVAAIRAETNTALYAMVAARIDLAANARLTRLLWRDPTSGRSEFDRLKTPAKAATLGKFKLRLAHLQALDELGVTEQWLDGIPATKIAHFAGEARVTDVGDMRDIGDAKRLTLLASLIHECRTCARDEVAMMFCKRMAVIHKKGKERLEQLREQHRAETERLIDVFGDVLAGAREASAPAGDGAGPAAAVAERAGRLLLKTLAAAGGVEQLSAAHEVVSAHHGNAGSATGCWICPHRTRCRSPRWTWCRGRCSLATLPRPPPRRARRGSVSLRRRVLDGHHPLGSVTSSRSWSRSTAASPSEARLLPQTRHLQVGESHRAENLIFELWEITSEGSSSRSPPFNDG